MPKKSQAELISTRCHCSKCGKIFPYKKREVEFESWSEGIGISFTCKGCKKSYSITLNRF